MTASTRRWPAAYSDNDRGCKSSTSSTTDVNYDGATTFSDWAVFSPALVAADDVITTTEDTQIIFSPMDNDLILSAYDSEIYGVGSSNVPGASTSISGTTQIVYTPKANYSGEDSFTYTVYASGSPDDTATITVTVTAVDDAPVITQGAAVTVTMSEDGDPTAFDLTLDASDVDAGSVLTWSVQSQAGNGDAVAAGTGLTLTVDYTPTTDFFGNDSFVVMVSDGALTDTIDVNVVVQSVNDAPEILQGNAFTVTMSEDGSPTPFTLTLNGSDIEGNNLAWSVPDQPDHGAASVTPNGAYTGTVNYTPTVNYNGADSFSVVLADGNTGVYTATVNVTVEAVNDAPTISQGDAVTVTMSENGSPTPFALSLSATDAENPEATLQWRIKTQPGKGVADVETATDRTVIDTITRTVSYSPNADWVGSDSFVVEVSDGALTDAITVNVIVEAVDDPTATPTATSTATNTAIPPTATATATNTAIPPTATATASSTAIPPTATATASSTTIPPTATATASSTAIPPMATATASSTTIPPTATATATPTATATNTPQPSGPLAVNDAAGVLEGESVDIAVLPTITIPPVRASPSSR
ncbi:MAG: tandem-95 repeat protein [Caldilineaceae bacterium]